MNSGERVLASAVMTVILCVAGAMFFVAVGATW